MMGGVPRGTVLLAAVLAACGASRPVVHTALRSAAPTHRSLSSFRDTTCLCTSDGETWCWSVPDAPVERVVANQIPGLAGCDVIAVGRSVVCVVVAESGAVRCTSTETADAPVQTVSGVVGRPRSIAVGHTGCAASESGDLFCWSLGVTRDDAWLGTPFVARRVFGFHGVRVVVASDWDTCSLDERGMVTCFGGNPTGGLGDGGTSSAQFAVRPVGVPSLVGLSGGADHFCGIDGAGRVWCWGGDALGQLGRGSSTPIREPALASAWPARQLVVAGTGFTCTANTDGELSCTGATSTGSEVYWPVATGRVDHGALVDAGDAICVAASMVSCAAVGGLAIEVTLGAVDHAGDRSTTQAESPATSQR